jgi:hypothetical protein
MPVKFQPCCCGQASRKFLAEVALLNWSLADWLIFRLKDFRFLLSPSKILVFMFLTAAKSFDLLPCSQTNSCLLNVELIVMVFSSLLWLNQPGPSLICKALGPEISSAFLLWRSILTMLAFLPGFLLNRVLRTIADMFLRISPFLKTGSWQALTRLMPPVMNRSISFFAKFSSFSRSQPSNF